MKSFGITDGKGIGKAKLKIAFWSEEDGCGTTSAMTAIASVCSDVWNMKTVLIQVGGQEGDLHQKLGTGALATCMVKEGNLYDAQGQWDGLLRLIKNKGLTEEMLLGHMVPVVKGRMYYLEQGGCRMQERYRKSAMEGMRQAIRFAERVSDLTFVDCGCGEGGMPGYLLPQADVVVVSISQERQNLDAYFQGRHAFHGKVIYLVNQYHPESIYNKKNLNRLYRLSEEELAVIPHNPVFRHVSERGKVERFVRRHMRCMAFDHQFYFMQELMQTAGMVVRAAGLAV